MTALSDYLQDISIRSSLENVSDWCTATYSIPTDAIVTIPSLDGEHTVEVYVNGSKVITFTGIIKEREFTKTEKGVDVTLHMYDKGILLIELEYSTSDRVRSFFGTAGNVCAQDSLLSPGSVGTVLTTLQGLLTAHDVTLAWELPQYIFAGGRVDFSGKIIDALRSMASSFSASEIDRLVYGLEGDRFRIYMVDLSTNIGSSLLNEKLIISRSIGETKLPGIRELRIEGAVVTYAMLPHKSSEPEITTTVSTDHTTGETTVTNVTVTYDSEGRVLSQKTITNSRGGSSLTRIYTIETVSYTYDPACGNRLLREDSSTKVNEESGSFAVSTKVKRTASTTYAFSTDNKYLKKQEISITENDDDEQPKKIIKEITEYTELAKNLTQKRYKYFEGSSISGSEPLKLKYTTTETFYGPPPEPVSGPSREKITRDTLFKRTVKITDSTTDEILEYSNPHLLDPALSGSLVPNAGSELLVNRITSQAHKLSGATRYDIAVQMSGDPHLYKGAVCRTTLPFHGEVVFTVMEVSHTISISSGRFITNLRGVRYL